MSDPSGLTGEFRLLHKIGEGGMADVFLAERLGDDGFRTRVALKRLHRGLAMDSYFIRQLVREARLLGQLEHANIVRVFDLRRVGDEYYVVMEFVDGIDLAAVVKVHRQRKTRIPRPFFFHVGLSLAEALSYAHSAVDEDGKPTPLIHRDIKPSNVMLSRRGIVKLTDFGIAHVGDGSVTGGLVQGTANYMSPEQAFGEDRLTPASDVYSLGALFYELLTGRPLIGGDNYLKAIHRVRERKVTLDELASLGVEPGLRMVVAKMLSADLAGRYTEMDSVRNDLQFVADRLKIDLSWHRIRAYVGRLMGLLGRAPGRATLSNISVPEELAAGQKLMPSGVGNVTPTGPVTPATPLPRRRADFEESEVTRAVAKDMLDPPADEPDSAVSERPSSEPSAPLSAELGAVSGDRTLVFPMGDAEREAEGDALPPEVQGERTMAHPGPAPMSAPSTPSTSDGWGGDQEQTRVFDGPSPMQAGVYGAERSRSAADPEAAPPRGSSSAWASDSQQLQPLGAVEVRSAREHLGPPPRAVRSGETPSYEAEQTLPPDENPTPSMGVHASPTSAAFEDARTDSEAVSPSTPDYSASVPQAAPHIAAPTPAMPGVAVGLPTGVRSSVRVESARQPPGSAGARRRRRRPRRKPISSVVLGVLVASVLFLVFVLFTYVYAVKLQASAVPRAPASFEQTGALESPEPGIVGRSSAVPRTPGPA